MLLQSIHSRIKIAYAVSTHLPQLWVLTGIVVASSATILVDALAFVTEVLTTIQSACMPVGCMLGYKHGLFNTFPASGDKKQKKKTNIV